MNHYDKFIETIDLLQEINRLESMSKPEGLIETARRLTQIKSLQKNLKAEEDKVLKPHREEFSEIKQASAPFIETLSNLEAELKLSIVEAFESGLHKKEDLLEEAEAAFRSNDLETSNRLTLLAAKCDTDLPHGVSIKKLKKFQIKDPSQVPREFLMLDELAIRKKSKEARQEINIAGVSTTYEHSVAVRA